MIEVAAIDGPPVRTSAVVLAQVWRDGRRQARLARLLHAMHVTALDEAEGRQVGELLDRTGTSDPADAALALAVRPGDRVVTSDPDDLRHLLDVAGTPARVVSC
jgi:hypothetical protein